MFRSRGFLALACGFTMVLALEGRSFAVDPAFAEEIKWLLNAGWRGDAVSLTHASHHLANAQTAAPGDPRPLYAWTLVQIKLGNLKQAASMMSGVVADGPDALGPRQAQIWLLADGKEYPTMLTGIMAMAVHLPRPDADAPNEEQKEAAKFLGRVFGYFTGPGAGLVPDAKWEQREKLITENLHSTLRESFQAGRDEVAKKFASTAGGKEPVKPDEKSASAPPEAAAKDAGPAPSAADQAAAAALKSKYLSDRGELEKKIAAAQEEVNRLSSQAQPIVVRMPKTQQIAQAKNAQSQTAKPVLAAKLKKEAQEALDDFVRDQQEFGRLKIAAESKNAEIAQLQNNLDHLTEQVKADAAKLGSAGASIMAVALPVSKTPVVQLPTAPAAPAGNAAASEELTTLDGALPLSLKVQRQRLLDSLAK